MSLCNGDGECLIQCDCECFNEETEEYNELCVCGHREHNGYCPSICCTPVDCEGCGIKIPMWLLKCCNNKCQNCDVQFGRHKLANITEDCCVCFENKIMIMLKCDHKICSDCWYNITKEGFGTNNNHTNTCPLCRSVNDWSNSTM